jgi:hypothetical protein
VRALYSVTSEKNEPIPANCVAELIPADWQPSRPSGIPANSIHPDTKLGQTVPERCTSSAG